MCLNEVNSAVSVAGEKQGQQNTGALIVTQSHQPQATLLVSPWVTACGQGRWAGLPARGWAVAQPLEGGTVNV